jgi:hypothetical protein
MGESKRKRQAVLVRSGVGDDEPQVGWSRSSKIAAFTRGRWALRVEFGLGALNMATSPEEVYPTALVPVKSVGIERVEEAGQGLTVDAAELNPAPKGAAKRARESKSERAPGGSAVVPPPGKARSEVNGKSHE